MLTDVPLTAAWAWVVLALGVALVAVGGLMV